ncbi:nuclease-related domain-containing protein [Streptomyces neyagawaensis]|uniref:Nuclease-related domain-containing protein n=1 Tax=Streptomyces neyagawaensis TaxID=42238 RepID=A0ABV3BD53_9ACTN
MDLLVVAPGGVCMIELKDWHGSVDIDSQKRRQLASICEVSWAG